ncbi:MAG: protein translocase subunit SecD [Opitutaceae bacterium]|jgi:SecD/SecF fusion protein|nr:protein translocase subunit SecD [Opitutaceae bacterium]
MLKRHLVKLTVSLAILLWAMFSLTPLGDKPFDTFLHSSAGGPLLADFNALHAEAAARVASKNAPSVYVALRDIARERKLDLTKFFPSVSVEASVSNIEKRNAILLDHLLAESKSRLQLGLDLKGGVAFTLEVDESAAKASDEHSRGEKLKKAIEIIGKRIDKLGVTEPLIRPVGSNRIEVQLPGVSTKDNPEIVDSLKKPALLTFHKVHPTLRPASENDEAPPGYSIMTLDEERAGRSQPEWLFIKQIPEMGGRDVADSYPYSDQYSRIAISLQFTGEGRKNFARVTRDMVAEARELGGGARLAIILDGKLYSAPTVREEIDSPSAQITGSFSVREAQELASVLNNPLDVPLVIREQYEVGPTLAEDAISNGVRSAIIGTALVVAFMVVFYSTGGLVAVASLAMNIVIIFGIMASFGATLTLPGLAGIVLTIGMAVDANILIFERMREEMTAGKSLRAATGTGYHKALWTILDAHIVQLLICAVMIGLGTGPIKGFGVTLAIGVVSTLFSVLITAHMVMEILVDSEWVRKITMRRILGRINVDFIKYGKPAFASSWIIVLLGLAVVIHKGDRIYGIDFTGGDVVELQFQKRLDIAQIRQAATSANIGEINATYTAALGGGQETLRVETADGRGPALVEALQKSFPAAGFSKAGESHVGASIGVEIRNRAFVAIGASMLITLLYIAFRFEFGFGIGAMFSSLHDILMTIGIFVLSGHHFSAPMVAAILAIAGYSINETVVVFDRIREELKINPNSTLRLIVNGAINKVFARTIMTATTTFLAALALFLFGGGVLRDISFTFLVGILTSTFSAIFVSSQVFYWWHKGDRKRVEARQDAAPTYEWDGSSNASK